MGRQVYCEDTFKIYRVGNGYVVHNADYDFVEKHTHISQLKTAKQVIYFVKKQKIPKTFSAYLLTSLIRLSDDEHYCQKIQLLLQIRKQKGKKERYVNRRAG